MGRTRLWDPYNVQNIENPYPMYQQLREERPVYHAQTGEWIITRYQDIKKILNSQNFLVGNRLDWLKRQVEYLQDKSIDFTPIIDALHSSIVLLNPPEHTQVRTLLNESWSDHNVNDLIKENSNTLLNALNSDNMDLIQEYSMHLPVMTIARIMGISLKDYQKLKALSMDVLQAFNLYTSFKKLEKINAAALKFVKYLRDYIHYRKDHLADDLVSKILIRNKEEDQGLSDDQLISICLFLFIAGEETTVNLVGTGILTLLNHPEEFEKLQNDRSLMPAAINELLRYEPPVHLVGRIASKTCTIGGQEVEKDGALTLCLGSANRDPEIFDEPDRFDINRNATRHIAFGSGIHFCLGSWLAKTQSQIALDDLITRYPKMKLGNKPLQWNDHLSVRGLASLPISLS